MLQGPINTLFFLSLVKSQVQRKIDHFFQIHEKVLFLLLLLFSFLALLVCSKEQTIQKFLNAPLMRNSVYEFSHLSLHELVGIHLHPL